LAADPDESGQAVHSGSFAPALASLIFNSLCRSTTVNASTNGTFRATDTAKCPELRSLWASRKKQQRYHKIDL